MISWKWKIRALTLRPSLDALTNVVATVHWDIVIIEEDNTEIVVNSGYTYLTPPADGSQFVAYENLTEQECINWIKQVLGPVRTTEYESEAEHRVLLKQGVVAQNTTTFPWSA
jgi:hypothetical protein